MALVMGGTRESVAAFLTSLLMKNTAGSAVRRKDEHPAGGSLFPP